MNLRYLFALSILAVSNLFSYSLSGQSLFQSGLPVTPLTSVPIAPGDHVLHEAIIYYPNAITASELNTLVNSLNNMGNGSAVREVSPGGHYVLTFLPGAEACTITGGGNGLGLTGGQGQGLGLPSGQGQEIDLNYILSPGSGIHPDPVVCAPGGGSFDPRAYDPLYGCGEISKIIPPRHGSGSVRIAILDAGRPKESQIVFPGVHVKTYDFTVPTPAGQDPTYNPHGRYVSDIIAGIFYREGLEEQLHLDEYRVMDNNLQATLFDVLSTFEMLLSEDLRPDLVSMSINFTPLACTEPGFVARDRSLLYHELKRAEQLGVGVLVSAGNDGNHLGQAPSYPASEPDLPTLSVVGASDCAVEEAQAWSNYGAAHVDFFAPGAAVRVPYGDCYYGVYGTSFATPLMVAKAALHATHREQFDLDEVLCQLRGETKATPGARYGFPAAATNSGHEACSAEMARAQPAVGLSNDQTLLSPNPCDAEISVRVDQAITLGEPYSVRILDVSGRLLTEQRTAVPTLRLPTHKLRSGPYWMSYTGINGTVTRRFVKR